MAGTDDVTRGSEAAKRLLVSNAISEESRPVCVVTTEQTVADVAECLSDNPGVNTAPVVDADGRLLGVIPMRLLLDDLFLNVAPEEFLAGLTGVEGLEEFGRMTRATTAGVLMEPPAYVSPEDSARHAFALMHARKLEGLPVVDAEMKVIGYLDRLHLVRLWLKFYGTNA
jgi:CBS domain-containing protein